MTLVAPLSALCVVEASSIARGFVALDAVAKKVAVTVKLARPMSPGKFVLMFGGDVESTHEGHAIAVETVGSGLLDALLLPGVHAGLLPAMDHALVSRSGEAIGIVEMLTVCAAVGAADAALKAVDVDVVRMQLAVGVGGKAWFTIAGALGDVQAALDAVRDHSDAARTVALECIAQPHAEVRGFLS